MGRRIDWNALKEDFLLSEFVDVQAWARSKLGRKTAEGSGHFARKTKGWTEEKEAMREEQLKMTVQKVMDKRSSKLANMLGDVYDHMMEKKELYMAEGAKGLETIWKIVMVANGLPTTISRNENTNQDVSKDKTVLVELVNRAKNAKRKSS